MADEFTNREKSSGTPSYGRVRSPAALGDLARQERKRQGLTLNEVYSASGLTTRFLSEFERGKPNASIRRVMDALQALGLEMIVLPRGEAERLLARHARSGSGKAVDGESAK
jgi:transcriptional regulator with XRE-family HTH domain